MKYAKISKCDIANGNGVRVVLWVSGCDLECDGCHNPELWNPDNGTEFTDSDIDTLVSYLNHDYIEGITFSGGHPLDDKNAKAIKAISDIIKERMPEKTQWLYTGLLWDNIISSDTMLDIISNIDVVVDGKFDINDRDVSLAFRGSANQNIIDVKRSLSNGSVVLWEEHL